MPVALFPYIVETSLQSLLLELDCPWVGFLFILATKQSSLALQFIRKVLAELRGER